ncbi:hypothetical protein ABT076_10830 [Streptomyces sp. NPDC002131]|uniref:hypothetical protein n=1 Tax=Streptomyces sp. NPDC002131 TaxID=3154535 RepID=UPI003328A8BD
MTAETFNSRYPVGTPVFAYPGARPEHGADSRLVTRTRTVAQKSSSGHDVVWVEGHGAYISLTHVDPVPESVFKAAREAETAAAVATLGALPVPVGSTVAPIPEPDMRAQLESTFASIRSRREAKEAAQLAADSVQTDNVEVLRERAERHAYHAVDEYWGYFNDIQKNLGERVITPLLDVVARLAAERDEARARVRELERPAIEAKRNEIRSSYVELISQAEQDRDSEGAAQVAQLLADAEAMWRREDEEAAS